MLNHIVIMGRLTADPVIRRTGNDVAVANFSVAVDRDYRPNDGGERATDFVDVCAWRGTAEFIQKYFHKGSMIVVAGRLQIRQWKDKDDHPRRSAEVVAESVYFGENKRKEDIAHNPEVAAAQPANYYQAPAATDDYAFLTDQDEQLPFDLNDIIP